MIHRFRNCELALADCSIFGIETGVDALHINVVYKAQKNITVQIILYNAGNVVKPYKSCSESYISRWKSVIAIDGLHIMKPNHHLACGIRDFYLEVNDNIYGRLHPYPIVSATHYYFP